MQTFIYADNYRGFNGAIIPLRQVNFLVGENSTGKSSFLELMRLFSDLSFWVIEPMYGGFEQASTKHFLDLVTASSNKKNSFSIGLFFAYDSEKGKDFGMIVTYVNRDGRPVPFKVSRLRGNTIITIEGNLWERKKSGLRFYFREKKIRPRGGDGAGLRKARSLIEAHKSTAGFVQKDVPSDRASLPLFFRVENWMPDSDDLDDSNTLILKTPPYPFGGHFIELAPIRSRPRRTYDAPQTNFSPEGEHVPYMIKRRLSSKSQAESFKCHLEKIGESSGLFQSVTIKQYGAGQLAPFEMRIMLGKASLDMGNVGYGVSQALPVIVEMLVRPKKSVLSVQQPEVHLHPKAQAAFGDLIAEVARADDKRFFVETHSDFTIDRFRLNLRRQGGVPSQLLFFERNETGNKVTPIEISENGELAPDQPASYREFFFNESLSLLA